MTYLTSMQGGNKRSAAIQLLVNYWEMSAHEIPERLDHFFRNGVQHITSFVPWQAFESDISHKLQKFVQYANDRKIHVSLIVTPEPGIHYPYAGLPKELARNENVLAKDENGNAIPCHLPPVSFALPSQFSEEYLKRYFSFLSRFQVFLSDLERLDSGILRNTRVVLTGGFWKYYRSAVSSRENPFGGTTGDRSKHASIAYRKFLEALYSHPEFSDSDPSEVKQWKSRRMDEPNSRRFFQEMECRFRDRSEQILRKKGINVDIEHYEVFTPEADPGFLYYQFLQSVSGGLGGFNRLSKMMNGYSQREAFVENSKCRPFIHWTSIGSFHSMSEQQKSFLILKSLVHFGGSGGGILLDERQWQMFSQGFRKKVEKIANSFDNDVLEIRPKMTYLAPQLWSVGGLIWESLSKKISNDARMTSSIDSAMTETHTNLMIVDPNWVFQQKTLKALLEWADKGKILALPRSTLYSPEARALLDKCLESAKPKMDIDLGIPYRFFETENGKLILYETVEWVHARSELQESWAKFIDGLLNLAEIKPACHLTDARLEHIILSRKIGDGTGEGLFVMNAGSESIQADIHFPEDVVVSDLSVLLSDRAQIASEPDVEPASVFSLEVPKYGVLPLAAEGMENKHLEFKQAQESAPQIEEASKEMAQAALPGLEWDEELEELLNLNLNEFGKDQEPSAWN